MPSGRFGATLCPPTTSCIQTQAHQQHPQPKKKPVQKLSPQESITPNMQPHLHFMHPKFKAPTYMYGIELNGCVAHMHLSLTNDKYKPQRQKHRTVEFNAGNIINYNMTVIESEQLCM